MTQEQAFEILKTGENTFLTGPPGSGKTHLLNKYISYLRDNDIPVGVTASTGVASTHMNGKTIHSWSGIGIEESLTDKRLKQLKRRKYLKKSINGASVLIIDEISMLHSYQFDMIDMICREIRQNVKPFGGLQVVCSGDFFQLPPVTSRDSYGGNWPVEARVWDQMDIKTCYLDEQYRHRDEALVRVLKDIRQDNVTEETTNLLMERHHKEVGGDEVTAKIYTHNRVVNTVNTKELKKIKGEEKVFTMSTDGKEALAKSLKNSCLSPERLVLKKGAKVMFTKNNFEKDYVNGTMGTVVDFDSDGYPVVETTDGRKVTAFPEVWKIEDEYGKMQAQITQIPLRLSWAVTIHKSQGMTLDAAEIDLSRSFEKGMGYVALSRIKKLESLTLRGFNDVSLQVSEKALTLDHYLKQKSEEAKEFIDNLSEQEKEDLYEEFIEKAKGGNSNKENVVEFDDEEDRPTMDPDDLPF